MQVHALACRLYVTSPLKTAPAVCATTTSLRRFAVLAEYKYSSQLTKGEHNTEKQVDYQLSLIDLRDAFMLQTEPDDYCDKLAVDCRSLEILSTSLTDDGPVYQCWVSTLSS